MASARSAVPSLDPSSTTTTSTGWVDATREWTVAWMPAASLYAGTITLTGSVTPACGPVARLCRRAAASRRSALATVMTPAMSIVAPTRLTSATHPASDHSTKAPSRWVGGGAGAVAAVSRSASLTVTKR